MDDRFRRIAALGATQHNVVSTAQLLAHGIDASMRSKWERKGLIDRIGPRAFAIAGSSPTFQRSIAAGLADLADAQRRTELTLRGLRVITFTHDDLRDRPDWVVARLREALAMAA